MTRFLVLILVLTMSQLAHGQEVVKIDLADWKAKKITLPFKVTSVENKSAMPEVVGTFPTKKKETVKIKFASASEPMIKKFISDNFTSSTALDIRLEINSMQIKLIEDKGDPKPYFFYSCQFFKNNTTEALYKFSAKNSVRNKKGFEKNMTNYVSRAISTSLTSFEKALEKHPEWKDQSGNLNAPNINLTSSVFYNKFISLGDTIPLDGTYKLEASDYSDIVQEEEKDEAYSYFMLSYSLDVIDENNKINMKIFPKAFFLRSKSWSKKSDSTDWKSHQQLLFDLASYHGRLLKKALESYNYTAGFYKTEANKIYNEISANYFDEMDDLQGETLYGAYKDKEKEWREKVDAYLKE